MEVVTQLSWVWKKGVAVLEKLNGTEMVGSRHEKDLVVGE
jgi:hypothetical protein